MQTICKVNTAVNVDNTSKLGLSNNNNIENENQRLNFPSSIVCEVNSNEAHCVEGAPTASTLEASQQLASEVNEIPSLTLKMSNTPTLPEIDERSQLNQVATICIVSDYSSEFVEPNLPTLMRKKLSHEDLYFVQNSPEQVNAIRSWNKDSATSNFEQWYDDYNYQQTGTSLEQSASLLHQAKQMNGEYKAPRIQAAVDTNLNFPNLKIKQSNAQFSEIRSNLDANLAYISSTDDASNTQNFSSSNSEPSKYSETKTFSHILKFHETTWKQQVSNRIVDTLASGKQDLELVIAPKSLGKIAIHVSSSGDILNLTIAADNLKTASLLSAALPEIENNLKDSGIGVLSTKLGSNGAHAEQEQNNEKSEAEPSTRFHGQSTESEDDEGAQKIGAVSYHTGKYSYEV